MFDSTRAARRSKRLRPVLNVVLVGFLVCTWTSNEAPAAAGTLAIPSSVTSGLPDACPGKHIDAVLTYALEQAQTQYANIRGRDLGTQFVNMLNDPPGVEFDRQYEVIGTGYDFCPNFFTMTHDEFASTVGGPLTYAMGWSLRYTLLTESLTETQAADALVAVYTPLLPGYRVFRERFPGHTGGIATDDVHLVWTKYASPHMITVTAYILHCGEQSYFGYTVNCSSRSAANEITMAINSL